MMKKLMSLGLVGILSASLMVGCSSNNDKEETVTIKYVDENGNVVKKDHVTKEEAKQIEQQQTTKKETIKEQPSKKETSKQHEDSTTNKHNYDDELYGNAARGTCPDCGRTAMVFNHGNGLKCAYCGFYDDGYFLDEEPDPSYSDNKEDEDYAPEDDSEDDYNYDEQEEPDDDNEDVYDSCIDPEATTNTDSNVEETPSEPAQ